VSQSGRALAVPEAPRNPVVEAAWKEYTKAFKAWADVVDSTTYYILATPQSPAQATQARVKAMVDHRVKRNEALMIYFELFDADQRARYGDG
jgi:hypothetical protein